MTNDPRQMTDNELAQALYSIDSDKTLLDIDIMHLHATSAPIPPTLRQEYHLLLDRRADIDREVFNRNWIS